MEKEKNAEKNKMEVKNVDVKGNRAIAATNNVIMSSMEVYEMFCFFLRQSLYFY